MGYCSKIVAVCMITRWVDIKRNTLASIVSQEQFRLSSFSCFMTCLECGCPKAHFPVPRWSDKMSAFGLSCCVRLKEFQSQKVSETPSNNLTFVSNYTPAAPAVSVWVLLLSAFRSTAKSWWWLHWQQSYLVDPASSHMLVSKIKPCMSKYKQLYTVKLRTAHYISNNLFDDFLLHG